MNGRHSGATEASPARKAIAVLVACFAGIVGAWCWSRGALAVGTLLVLTSVVLLRGPGSIWAAAPRVDLAPRWQRWGLLAVCAVAVCFRCYQMEPPGLWGDDAINGLLAFDVLDGKIRSPLQLIEHSFSTFHALSNYLIAGAFLIWGPDPLSIRVPGIVANLLAVPALFGIVSPLFGPRAGLLAALFFASSPFEIGHAKGFLQNVLGQSLEIAGLCLLVQGALRRRPWMLIASGIPIAVAVYTYHAAKLVPLVAAIAAWQVMRAARSRGLAIGRLLFTAAALFALTVTPAVYTYVQHPEALTDRVSGTALWGAIRASGNWWPLWDSLWRTLAVFHYQQGPIYHWFGIGTDAGVGVIVGCFVLHGLVQSLCRWWQPAHALLLGWFAVAMVPGLLSSEAPRGYRILNAAPVVFIWAALPLARIIAMRGVGRLVPLRRYLAIALVIAVPLVDFNYYFYRVYTHGVFRWFQAEPMVEMARELRSYGPGWTGYVVADNFTRDYESLRFLARAWQLELRDVASLGDALPVRDLSGPGALFMIMRTPFEGAALLPALYPGIAADLRHEPVQRWSWFDPLFTRGEPSPQTPITAAFFPVSRETAEGAHGLTATYASAAGVTVAIRAEREPALRGSDDLPPMTAGAPPISKIVWHGSLLAATEGTYQFRVESSADVILLIGTEIVATRESPIATRNLAEGLHAITVAAAIADPVHMRVFWQPPGESESAIPPDAFFHRPVHGLLAEFRTVDGLRRRIDPFPFYIFLASPFPGTYSARWSGRIQVPKPGAYKLSIESDRTAILEVDGRRLDGDERLANGPHQLSISMDGIEGPPRLRVYWQLPERERELIPPEAFDPG